MSKKSRPRPTRSRPAPKNEPASRLPLWVPIGIIGLVVAVVVIGIVASSQSDDGDDAFAYSEVGFVGTALAPQPQSGSDPAIGTTAGAARGSDPEGINVEFVNGSPRALMFVAHWCSHCQAEFDAMNAWEVEGNEFPSGVEIQTIATWTDPARPNYPPGAWLAENGMDGPTILDDRDFTLAQAFGLAGTPMWIFVDADGRIVDRTGSLPPAELSDRMAALVG